MKINANKSKYPLPIIVFNNLSFTHQKFVIQSLLNNSFKQITNLALTKELTNNLHQYDFNTEHILHRWCLEYNQQMLKMIPNYKNNKIIKFLKTEASDKLVKLTKFLIQEFKSEIIKIVLSVYPEIFLPINQKFKQHLGLQTKVINIKYYNYFDDKIAEDQFSKMDLFIHSILFNKKQILNSVVDFIIWHQNTGNFEKELFIILDIISQTSLDILEKLNDKIAIHNISGEIKLKIAKFIKTQKFIFYNFDKSIIDNSNIIDNLSFYNFNKLENEGSKISSVSIVSEHESHDYIIVENDIEYDDRLGGQADGVTIISNLQEEFASLSIKNKPKAQDLDELSGIILNSDDLEDVNMHQCSLAEDWCFL